VYSNGLGVHGLTDVGRRQAEQLADRLEDIPFAALYCSPILRALQTAQIVAERLHLTYEIAEGLREYDVGILEGKSYDEDTQGLFLEITAQWMERRNWAARIEGGESYDDIAARFMPFIETLEAAYRDTDSNVLLVSHGGTLRSMLPLLLSNVDYASLWLTNVDDPSVPALRFDYATSIVAELRGEEWLCLRWGDERLLGE
jgi:probable phosphoglycerate mutase